jgi:hypothetical protein
VYRDGNLSVTFICRKFGSLNLLEPSGPIQACTAIALTLLLEYQLFVIFMQRPAVQLAATIYA